jgi:exopolysaccharide/PEP-CTERM locus tyrosine autokinase
MVDKALDRARKSGMTQSTGAAGAVPPGVVPLPIVDAVGSSGKISKRLTVDIASLRAVGCIAEESQGRQFAGHYREIKRPLIEKALSVQASDSGIEPLLIMVTSALPGDGKTFTSINLALSMARERDVSVLLLDADVQKADVSNVFGLKGEPGLLNALNDETIDVESLILRTNLPGLSLLPAGAPAEGATELLSSKRMRHIVSSLIARSPRRIVLLDSPPLLITSEARALIKIAGQIVLVIRADKTPRRAVQDAMNLFDEQQRVGLVLNDTRRGLTQGYYGYGYYGTEQGDSTR